jgi:hypothetical protein
MQLLKKFKIENRINDIEEITNYLKNKPQKHYKHLIENIYYISLYKNEEMNTIKNIQKYWISINKENKIVKLKEKKLFEGRNQIFMNESG